jgi:hypothetical protein
VREDLGLSRIESFDDPIFQEGVGAKLASIYDSPDDIDLWVAGLAENSQDDSLVGSTFSSILADQFSRLRDGDRFWYENQFSTEDVNRLNNIKLSDIIQRNTDIENIQENVFVAPTESGVIQVSTADVESQAGDTSGLTGDMARTTDTPALTPAEVAEVVNGAINADDGKLGLPT